MNKTTYKGFNTQGKKIAILAGIHGNEINPIYTAMKLVRDSLLTDLEVMKDLSEITVVNTINKAGLMLNKRGIDKPRIDDLNRFFDSDESDVVGELKKVIDEHDVIIDLHASPNCTEFVLIDINEYTNSMIEWCVKAGVFYACRYSSNKTIKHYCQDKGKTSITYEMKGMNFIDEVIAHKTIEDIKSLIENVNKFNLEKTEPNIKEIVITSSYKDGLLLHSVNLGDIVNKNDVISRVANYKGDVVLEIKSPVNGRIISLSHSYVCSGFNTALIQPL